MVGLVKDLLREKGLKERVLVSRTGCLKHCSLGVTAAVYPDNVWYQGVGEADLAEICSSHLSEGQPVARLLLSDDAPWE
jgi:(2Fe-2S) ferredoxin